MRNEKIPNLPGQITSIQESNFSDSLNEDESREKKIDFNTQQTEPLKTFFTSSDLESSSIDTKQTSDQEFDLQKFRSLNPKQLQEILPAQTSKKNIQIKRAKPGEVYKYLGQSYILEYLQERNKNPRVLLNLNLSALVIGDSGLCYGQG
eukprot:TRINITY_DN108798_c0_g1_i1.p1 TRINITY_DN108798_c0_g1~~TRINITY_DN108798_c0_g1_i1.p1  ORF type:complete len:156 (+),score=10.94 TRINITY_DN108798_c0_g1_i1:24-470(+)